MSCSTISWITIIKLLSILIPLLYNIKKSVKKKFGNPYMNIQEKFKAIRKQRKLSLRDLANVAGSASSISDFEKGKTNLSNDVLLQLLGFMVVEINEVFEWSAFQDAEFLELMTQVENALQTQDIAVLIQKRETFQEFFVAKKHYIYHIISLVLDVIISKLQEKEPTPEIISELTNYFFSLDYWTNLDVGLLGNIVHHFTTEALVLFTDSILKNTPNQLRNNLDRIKIDTVINCLSVLLARREKNASKALLQLLSRKQFPTYFTYEKLCISEFKAIYMYIWCDKEEADNIHQTILKTVSLLFTKDEANKWDDYFKEKISSADIKN